METRNVFRIGQWAGINRRAYETEIAENESPYLLNVELFQDGFRTRPCEAFYSASLTSLPNQIFGLFDGYNHVIAVTTGGIAYTLNKSTVEWTERKTGLATSILAYPSFASYNGLDMMVNSTILGTDGDNPQKWDGTNWADLGGSPPKAHDIEVWRNHVFLTGLGGNAEGEVRFSEQELPETWPSGNWLRPTKKEAGAKLVCSRACPFPGEEDGTRLVVFAQDRIYHFDGFNKTLFQIYMVKKGIGCIAKRSVVNAEGYTYWLDQNGFYCSPDAGYTVNNISWNMQPFTEVPTAYLYQCCGTNNRAKRQIWWSFPYTNVTFIYHYGLSTPMAPAGSEGARHVWSIYDHQMNCLENLLLDGIYTIAGGYGGNVAALVGDMLLLDPHKTGLPASGRDVHWRIHTKRFYLGTSPSSYGVLRKLNLVNRYLASHEATVTMQMDYVVGSTQENTIATDAGTAGLLHTNEVYYNQLCKAVKFIIGNVVHYTPATADVIDGVETGPGYLTEPTTTLNFYDLTIETIPKQGLR